MTDMTHLAALETRLSNIRTPSMTCRYCHDEGVIETDNNGPIGPCPVCGPSLKEWQEELAWDSRERMNQQGREIVAGMNARQGQR